MVQYKYVYTAMYMITFFTLLGNNDQTMCEICQPFEELIGRLGCVQVTYST